MPHNCNSIILTTRKKLQLYVETWFHWKFLLGPWKKICKHFPYVVEILQCEMMHYQTHWFLTKYQSLGKKVSFICFLRD